MFTAKLSTRCTLPTARPAPHKHGTRWGPSCSTLARHGSPTRNWECRTRNTSLTPRLGVGSVRPVIKILEQRGQHARRQSAGGRCATASTRCLHKGSIRSRQLCPGLRSKALDASLLSAARRFSAADRPTHHRHVTAISSASSSTVRLSLRHRRGGRRAAARRRSVLACSFGSPTTSSCKGITEARELFERLLALRNDVGFCEEYDPRLGRQLGIPQPSRMCLVNTHSTDAQPRPGGAARRPAQSRRITKLRGARDAGTPLRGVSGQPTRVLAIANTEARIVAPIIPGRNRCTVRRSIH